MHQLPEAGYLRLPQIIGNPKAKPPIPAVIPVSKSTWWAGVKSGRFPQSLKLGPRVTAWKVEDIRALIETLSTDRPAATVEQAKNSPEPHTENSDAPPLVTVQPAASRGGTRSPPQGRARANKGGLCNA